jgi:hypothetical protein
MMCKKCAKNVQKTDEMEKFSYSELLRTLREVDGKTFNNVIRLAFHVLS